METHLEIRLADQAATEALGAALSACVRPGSLICLQGDLGAGKTTLVRGFLRAQGHQGGVKSPTYTLVEPYTLAGRNVFHFDLYRLGDPEELEFMGARDYFAGEDICLVEWPEKAGRWLPTADVRVQLDYENSGRHAELHMQSEALRECLAAYLDQI